jgi:cytidylate kinase
MIITLSRQLGSDGDSIAARVATALGLTLVDREYVHKIALAAGVPDNLLQMLMYERRRSLAGEVMDSLGGRPGGVSSKTRVSAASPLLGTFAPMMPPATVSPEEADQSVGLIIKDIASRGGVLILGQGAQVWLRGYAGACHVQVVAPLDLRIARVAEREGIKVAAARRRVRDCDQARSDYLARYHNAQWLDPLLYHLVINTGQTSVEAAVSLILHAAQAVGSGA